MPSKEEAPILAFGGLLIRICADDFGISTGVSETILQLGYQRRLNSISVMTENSNFARYVSELRHLKSQSIEIGLHWMSSSLKTSNRAVRASLTAQFHAFEASLKFAPDYIDSHRHVHQVPWISPEFCRTVQSLGSRCLRSTRRLELLSVDPIVRLRKKGLELLGRRFHKLAASYDWPMFDEIWLTLDYEGLGTASAAERMERIPKYKKVQVILHPGLQEDPELFGRDTLYRNRDKDFELALMLRDTIF